MTSAALPVWNDTVLGKLVTIFFRFVADNLAELMTSSIAIDGSMVEPALKSPTGRLICSVSGVDSIGSAIEPRLMGLAAGVGWSACRFNSKFSGSLLKRSFVLSSIGKLSINSSYLETACFISPALDLTHL